MKSQAEWPTDKWGRPLPEPTVDEIAQALRNLGGEAHEEDIFIEVARLIRARVEADS